MCAAVIRTSNYVMRTSAMLCCRYCYRAVALLLLCSATSTYGQNCNTCVPPSCAAPAACAPSCAAPQGCSTCAPTCAAPSGCGNNNCNTGCQQGSYCCQQEKAPRPRWCRALFNITKINVTNRERCCPPQCCPQRTCCSTGTSGLSSVPMAAAPVQFQAVQLQMPALQPVVAQPMVAQPMVTQMVTQRPVRTVAFRQASAPQSQQNCCDELREQLNELKSNVQKLQEKMNGQADTSDLERRVAQNEEDMKELIKFTTVQREFMADVRKALEAKE